MKIGFVGRWSPEDKSAWSGTYYFAWKEISKHYQVEQFHYKWIFYIREYLILHKQVQKIRNKKIAVEFLKGYAKYFSKQLEKDLAKRKVDILFCPGAPQLLAYCNTDIPIIYLADATFQQLQHYYLSFRDLANYNIKQGIELDKRTYKKSTHIMLASDWAKSSAINDYGIAENKISVAPLGANLEKWPSETDTKKEKTAVCNLLFLGVEWERKGGQIALDTFYQLQKNNFNVRLTIVGCVPPFIIEDPHVSVIPFINKNIPAEEKILEEIIHKSHFLLLPTRAECAGIAFCEASAYGIPSITTDTGGVSSYVENGINGFALPFSATAKDYAKSIQEIYLDNDKYTALCKNSRKKFEEILNWEAWGKSFCNIAELIYKK